MPGTESFLEMIRRNILRAGLASALFAAALPALAGAQKEEQLSQSVVSGLSKAIADAPGFEGSGSLLTISDARLSVRLTRGVEFIEPHHVGLARAISEVAQQHGMGTAKIEDFTNATIRGTLL